MTTRELTRLRAIAPAQTRSIQPLSERLFRIAFGAVQWPWLLRSLHGGSRASKRALLDRLDLPLDALPHLGSWKADTYLLHRLVDLVEQRMPRTVVELGSGATTLVLAKALELQGSGDLHSYDQNAEFVAAVARWLADHGAAAHLHCAPLSKRTRDWPGLWYDLKELPTEIDLLVIDGPPWAVHPYARGAAEALFSRLSEGGLVVLDDAARPGERVVARRWRRSWPSLEFRFESGGSKGTLIGVKQQPSTSPAADCPKLHSAPLPIQALG
jgi:hypothetical protein